jgi:hypothetical protein
VSAAVRKFSIRTACRFAKLPGPLANHPTVLTWKRGAELTHVRHTWGHCARVLGGLAADLVPCAQTSLRLRTAKAVEKHFLRKQLALYRERQVKPRQVS